MLYIKRKSNLLRFLAYCKGFFFFLFLICYITLNGFVFYFIIWRFFTAKFCSYKVNKEYKRKFALKLKFTLIRLGPAFVKAGQFLATRGDLLDDILCEALMDLQDRLPSVSWRVIRRIIENELDADLNSCFQSVIKKPVASASIAQVHKAVTIDGELVALKIVKPGIERSLRSNIELLFFCIYSFGFFFGYGKKERLLDIVYMIEQNLKVELNMSYEAAASERIRLNMQKSEFNKNVYIPKVFWDYTRRSILVTEWIEGLSIREFLEIGIQGNVRTNTNVNGESELGLDLEVLLDDLENDDERFLKDQDNLYDNLGGSQNFNNAVNVSDKNCKEKEDVMNTAKVRSAQKEDMRSEGEKEEGEREHIEIERELKVLRKNAIARNLALIFFSQVCNDGFFHADLHQGNIMINSKGQIVLLDFGMVSFLSEKDRLGILSIIHAFTKKDYDRVAYIHSKIGYIPKDAQKELFSLACSSITEPIFGKKAREIKLSSLLTNLFSITEDFRMKTQPQLLLLQKNMICVEGLIKSIDKNVNLWKIMEPWFDTWVKNQLRFNNKAKRMEGHIRDVFDLLVEKIERYSKS